MGRGGRPRKLAGQGQAVLALFRQCQWPAGQVRAALLLIWKSAQGPWLCPGSIPAQACSPRAGSRVLGQGRGVEAPARPGVTGAQSQEFLEFLAPGFAANCDFKSLNLSEVVYLISKMKRVMVQIFKAPPSFTILTFSLQKIQAYRK